MRAACQRGDDPGMNFHRLRIHLPGPVLGGTRDGQATVELDGRTLLCRSFTIRASVDEVTTLTAEILVGHLDLDADATQLVDDEAERAARDPSP